VVDGWAAVDAIPRCDRADTGRAVKPEDIAVADSIDGVACSESAAASAASAPLSSVEIAGVVGTLGRADGEAETGAGTANWLLVAAGGLASGCVVAA